MTWRRLNLILFILTALVAALRILSGNLLAALLPAAVAVYCGSVAFEIPIVQRVRQIARLIFRKKKR